MSKRPPHHNMTPEQLGEVQAGNPYRVYFRDPEAQAAFRALTGHVARGIAVRMLRALRNFEPQGFNVTGAQLSLEGGAITVTVKSQGHQRVTIEARYLTDRRRLAIPYAISVDQARTS